MKLVVGLGNPGNKYRNTRHNVGFMVLDALASKITKLQITNYKQIQSTKFKLKKKYHSEIVRIGDVVFAKPQTFMNSSGEAVSKLVNFYKIQLNELYVVHDDLDIDLGKYKVQKGKGPKVHGGLSSIYEKLGSKDFWRVRVGIENRNNESLQNSGLVGIVNQEEERRSNKILGKRYVLQQFKNDERGVIERVVSEIVGELVVKLRS